MTNIILDIDNSTLILSGDISIIHNNRRARSNFESNGGFLNPENIVFSFEDTEDALNEKYEAICRLFKKFDLTFQQTPNAKNKLKEIDQKKADFSAFSEKARNIRNNNHINEELKEFTKTLSSTLKRTLYTAQLLCAYHLSFAQNACNFSVPGAGKTSIVYGAYAYLKHTDDENKQVGRLLIICPLSAFKPWEDEYAECFGEKPTSQRLTGMDSKERTNYFLSQNPAEITLMSYQGASNSAEDIKAYLNRYKDVMVVLDEAHRIKNTDPDAVWAQAILSIADSAKSRVVLTGTPAPNGYDDLWNLYKFIWPHKKIIEFPQHYLANIKAADAKERLIEQISPYFIRIKKSNLNLPEPKHHDPIYVSMDAEQKAIYDYIEQKYINSFERNPPSGSFGEKLRKAKIIRLRQCLTNPAQLQKPLKEHGELDIDDRHILKSIKDYKKIPEKFIKAGDLIKNIIKNDGPAGKVIIWAYFIQNIDDLYKYLQEDRKINCKILYGKTPTETEEDSEDIQTRERIIHEFHDNNCPFKVIIANPFAVGESISLHKACHNAIYLEKDFNAINYMQSKDRIHRYGLNEDDIINYYYLISENTIDDTIHNRVLEKERRMLEIIEDDIPLLQMNMDNENVDDDDIKTIIRDYHARKPA